MTFTPSTRYCPVRHSPSFAIPQLSPMPLIKYVRKLHIIHVLVINFAHSQKVMEHSFTGLRIQYIGLFQIISDPPPPIEDTGIPDYFLLLTTLNSSFSTGRGCWNSRLFYMTTPRIPDFFYSWPSGIPAFAVIPDFFLLMSTYNVEGVGIPDFFFFFCRNWFGIPGFFCQQLLEFQIFLSNLLWNSIFCGEKIYPLWGRTDIIWNSPLWLFHMQSFTYDAYDYLAYELYDRTRLFSPVAK